MAFKIVRTRKEADKLADAIMEINGGYQPTIFTTGRSFRVQDDNIGNDKFDAIMDRLGIDRA